MFFLKDFTKKKGFYKQKKGFPKKKLQKKTTKKLSKNMRVAKK